MAYAFLPQSQHSLRAPHVSRTQCANSSTLGLGLQGCWSRGPVRDLCIDFGFDNQGYGSLRDVSSRWKFTCSGPVAGQIRNAGSQHRDYHLLPVRMKTVILGGARAQPISKYKASHLFNSVASGLLLRLLWTLWQDWARYPHTTCALASRGDDGHEVGWAWC